MDTLLILKRSNRIGYVISLFIFPRAGKGETTTLESLVIARNWIPQSWCAGSWFRYYLRSHCSSGSPAFSVWNIYCTSSKSAFQGTKYRNLKFGFLYCTISECTVNRFLWKTARHCIISRIKSYGISLLHAPSNTRLQLPATLDSNSQLLSTACSQRRLTARSSERLTLYLLGVAKVRAARARPCSVPDYGFPSWQFVDWDCSFPRSKKHKYGHRSRTTCQILDLRTDIRVHLVHQFTSNNCLNRIRIHRVDIEWLLGWCNLSHSLQWLSHAPNLV